MVIKEEFSVRGSYSFIGLKINKHNMFTAKLDSTEESAAHYNESKQLIKLVDNKDLVSSFKYQDGLLSSVYSEIAADQSKLDEYFYNEDGLLVEKRSFVNMQEVNKHFYHYDKDAILRKEISKEFTKHYEYNDRGQKILTHVFRNLKKYATHRFSYNSFGKLAKLEELAPGDSIYRTHKYSYSEHQLLEDYVCLNIDRMALEARHYEYSNFYDSDWLNCSIYRIINRSNRMSNPLIKTISRSLGARKEVCEVVGKKSYKLSQLAEGKYIGELRNKLPHGLGSLASPTGFLYKGDFENGRMNGYGIISWADGSFYRGQFANDRLEGLGHLYWADGSEYRGQFKNGKMAGNGILIPKSGTVIHAFFRDNRAVDHYRSNKYLPEKKLGYLESELRANFNLYELKKNDSIIAAAPAGS